MLVLFRTLNHLDNQLIFISHHLFSSTIIRVTINSQLFIFWLNTWTTIVTVPPTTQHKNCFYWRSSNCTMSCVHTVCIALPDLNKHLSMLAGHLNPVKSNGLMHSILLYMESSHRSLLLEHYKSTLNKNNKIITMDSLNPEWYQSVIK